MSTKKKAAAEAATSMDASIVGINCDDSTVTIEDVTPEIMEEMVAPEPTQAEKDYAILCQAEKIKRDSQRFMAARAVGPI